MVLIRWDEREKRESESTRVSILYDELSSFLGVVGSVLIMGDAAVLLAQGHLLVGTVVAYLQLHNEIVWPFIEMSSLWRQTIEGRVSVKRIEQVLSVPVEQCEALKIPEDVEHVEIRHADFSYDGATNVLTDICFEAHKGEIVCLLGENGAGKSTLLKMLCGLYLPDRGEVYLDDICLTAETMQTVRSAYSFVMQKEHVFDGTVRDNLLFGVDVPVERLDACAKKTGFDVYIRDLESGYDTVLTNGSLSGGELKKLSLTRMLLADKPVVVLDEPFAHLDAEGCKRLTALLRELRMNKIVILVTHNHELVQYADRVVRLADGRVV